MGTLIAVGVSKIFLHRPFDVIEWIIIATSAGMECLGVVEGMMIQSMIDNKITYKK